MAKYEGYQSILNASLGQYKVMGFRAEPTSDHGVVLWFDHLPIASMRGDEVNVLHIRKVCHDCLQGII